MGDKTEIIFSKIITKNKTCKPVEKSEKINLEINLALEW